MFSSHSWLPPFGMAATAQWPEILRRLQHAVKVDAVPWRGPVFTVDKDTRLRDVQ